MYSVYFRYLKCRTVKIVYFCGKLYSMHYIYIYTIYTIYYSMHETTYCIINTPYALSVKKHFRPNKSRKTIPLT